MAGRGWELFEERAWNGDGKYSFDKQAMQKARATIRRINDGRVELGGSTAAAKPTYTTTASGPSPTSAASCVQDFASRSVLRIAVIAASALWLHFT